MVSRSTYRCLGVVLLLFVTVTAHAPAEAADKKAKPSIHPALVQVDEDPKLPRVLLIGDSITMGYTQPFRELLAKKANVIHPDENCGPSSRIVDHLDNYLGKKHWDVIQLNCGIHDLTYLNDAKKVTSPKAGGNPQVPLDKYPKIVAADAACAKLPAFEKARPENQPDAE